MNIVILLTACVNPQGMSYTVLQNAKERLTQYKESIDYYVSSTTLKIVVVENTGFNFKSLFNNSSLYDRVEFLTFQGNDFDKEKGKGYGEAKILQYAFDNSIFLRSADMVVKISGRYITTNFEALMTRVRKKGVVYANLSKIRHKKLCDSRFFVAPPEFYTKYFLPICWKINDSKNVYFEHVLFEAILSWKNNNKSHSEFLFPILFSGKTGTTGRIIVNSNFSYPSAFIKYIIHKLGIYINRK
mgnify:CR=1 FL=1